MGKEMIEDKKSWLDFLGWFLGMCIGGIITIIIIFLFKTGPMASLFIGIIIGAITSSFGFHI